MKLSIYLILLIGYAVLLNGCKGSSIGASQSIVSELPPGDVVASPTLTAYQDKTYSFAVSSASSTVTTVTFENEPTWMTYNAASQTIGGVPDSNTSISNLLIRVNTADGKSTLLGPYDIAVNGDPLKVNQWHLNNTGQKNFATNGGTPGEDMHLSQTIKSGITGNNVKVAISDTGIQIAHEDLAANILAGASKNYNLAAPYSGDPTPSDTFGNFVSVDPDAGHGTSVAGIIAAVGWNNIGTRGVAPNAKLAGLWYINAPETNATTVDQASGAFDIFNYSYGSNFFMPGSTDTLYGKNQMAAQVTTGRSNKGSLFVEAAGNSYVDVYPSDFSFSQSDATSNCAFATSDGNGHYACVFAGNANISMLYSGYPYVIQAAALSAKGVRSSYSNPGSSLWVSAPGGEFGTADPAIMTTDIEGCNKGLSSTLITASNSFENSTTLNPNCKYTTIMNGTSSATPNTVGAIALILEANPNLTWRDVKYVLAATADPVDVSTTTRSHPGQVDLSGYVYEQGWITNAAGFKFNNWYGFGRINIDNAVTLAKSVSGTLLPAFKMTGPNDDSTYYSSGTISKAIPDNSATGTSSTITVRHNYIVEAVQIRVLTNHPNISNLGLELYSPSGTKSILFNINSGTPTDRSGTNFIYTTYNADFQLLSNAFYGEHSRGDWTLKVVDGRSGSTGNLLRWDIQIFGHIDPNSGDTSAPLPVTNLTNADHFNSAVQSPAISWTASASSDVMRYELSIGSTSGGTDIYSWYPEGLATSAQISNLTLTYGHTYYVNVRAVDTSENVSSVVTSSWLYDPSSPATISISGPSPAQVSSTTDAVYTVTYTNASAVTLASGDVTVNTTGTAVCSKAVSGTGTVTRTVTLSSCTGDGNASISIAAGTATNASSIPSLASGPSAAVVVNNSGLGGSSASPIPLAGFSLTNSFSSRTFTANRLPTSLNSSNPLPPRIISIGALPFDLGTTPSLYFDTVENVTYEIRLKKTEDHSIVQDWTPVKSPSQMTELSLNDNTSYYFELRSRDLSGCVSEISVSSNWKTNFNFYRKVAVGNAYACALTLLGSVKCWGHDGIVNSKIPGVVSGYESNVTDLIVGDGYICVIQDGDTKCRSYSRSADELGTSVCLIAEDSTVKCRGKNNYGQLGDGTTIDRESFTALKNQLSH